MTVTSPVTIDTLAIAMLKCEQTKGQTVYQHGITVKEHLEELVYSDPSWKLPSWYHDYRNQLISNLYHRDVWSAYTVYHDCGKPFSKVIDADGKVHFPNHAEVSKNLFLEAGGNPVAAKLIGWDMCVHTCSSDEIDQLCREEWTVKDASTLLLTALAEIHSNAKLFGSCESISFKSKFKTIERRGRQICKFFFGENK